MRVRVMTPPVEAALGWGAEDGDSSSSSENFSTTATGLARARARAVIEVDEGRLIEIHGDSRLIGELEAALGAHGLALESTRAFKSGSVAKRLPSRGR